jgi:hypothetical protein
MKCNKLKVAIIAYIGYSRKKMTVLFLYMCVSQTAAAVGEPAMSSVYLLY